MVSNAQIRKQARQMLGGGIFQQQWLFALIVSLIAGAILGVSSIVVLIVCGIIMLGEAKYYLQCSRQEIAVDKIEVLFDGIKGEIGQNILLGVLVSVYVFLWSLLLVIPGIIKSYAYSMAFYLKVDHPEYTAKQAIKESEQLMYGHKMQLFLLDLSFIGWIIVGAFCFGVGTLWVTAYQKSARVQFYRNLIGESNVAN
ncbi:MAG: DUF975 family protein [Clostridia bacterium]|nr:DUF975 family protein [Clostridia bacterium]